MSTAKTTMCPIERNIRETIKRMKQQRVTAVSMDNLFQITPTKDVTVPVNSYRAEFEWIAHRVARDLSFQLLY